MGDVLSIGKILELAGGYPEYAYTTFYTSAGLNRVTDFPINASSFIIAVPASNGTSAFVDSVGYNTYATVFAALIRTSDTTCARFVVRCGNTGSGSSPPVRFSVESALNQTYTSSSINGNSNGYSITLSNGTLQFYARDFWSNYQNDYVLTAKITINILVWRVSSQLS